MNWIYHHDLSPFIIKFTEGIGIRWYGFAYLLGFFIGYLILKRMVRDRYLTLDSDEQLDLLLTVALSGILGGRLGYVLLYGLQFVAVDPLYPVRIWQGGMSIHGGVLGAVIGMYWYTRSQNVSFFRVSDVAALATPPGLFFGRIANFINGELWGRPTNGEWGVVFPRAGGDGVPRHPSQLYEAVVEGPLLLVFLLWIYSKFPEKGYLSSAFMIGYGVVRFFVEFTRAPDPHIGYEFLGMTRGQEFSLLFVAIGVGLWIYHFRTETDGV